VIHSDDDKSVPVRQAIDFVTALRKACAPHRFVHYQDRGHMGLNDDVIRETRAFVAELEKK
jgi:dipeptidyl aminopeptidase/acylaminoacyl peptidase